MKLFIATLLCGAFLSSTAFAEPDKTAALAEVDFNAFMALSAEVQTYRKGRLISKNDFLLMAEEPETVILDTRSKRAYDAGHLGGAIHLNFSDFTASKLKKILPEKDVRILIYCNNNFTNNVPPFQTKKLELALNIPTFINLYGYGYKNIYELKDGLDINDPELKIVASVQE